jgi:hypothetical protein
MRAIAGLFSVFCLMVGCAAPPQAARSQASAGSAATAASVDTAVAQNDDDYETVFVPPPVGSLLGGGSVRVPKKTIAGNDENALLGHIRHLNAAAGTAAERPYVVSAVSRATGVSERELQAQQDILRLRFGELCAINAYARGDSDKVQQIATMRARGQSWSQVAKSNGMSVATVVQTTRNADDLTVTSYSNAMDRAKGGQNKMKAIGVKVQPNVRPGG